MVIVRPFVRSDREQLTSLADAHVASAVPGASIPTATLLNQLERPLDEYVVGPWVTELATLVALEADRIVAAAHLRRYTSDDRASDPYRDHGEIVWLLCWPDRLAAGRAVRDTALEQLSSWGVRGWAADGSLPVPGVYGVSDAWHHIQSLYQEAGFDPSGGQVEVVFAGPMDGFPEPGPPPVGDVLLDRQVGPLGTAFNAVLAGEVVGTFEVDSDLTRGGTNLAMTGWADECNHWVRDDLRGRGIGTWLVANGASWLRLGGTTRFLTYAIEDETFASCAAYYARYGLRPVNRTVRGWHRSPAGPQDG